MTGMRRSLCIPLGLALIPHSRPLLFTFCFSFLAFLARFFVLCVDAALRPSWVQASPRSYFGVFGLCRVLVLALWGAPHGSNKYGNSRLVPLQPASWCTATFTDVP